MLPSALIRKGKFANFWLDETTNCYQARTYMCSHRLDWIGQTEYWLAERGLKWEQSTMFSSLLTVTFIDKTTYMLFKLTFDGSHDGRCSC